MKPLIDCVRDFVMQFPELKDGCLMIDYLGNKAIEYTVDSVPCESVYRRYTDGGCLKQFLFIFASREPYGADVEQCIANLEFYEHFESWIEEQNQNGNLPDLDGREPFSIEVSTSGYPFDCEPDSARYQIQLRLLYEE